MIQALVLHIHDIEGALRIKGVVFVEDVGKLGKDVLEGVPFGCFVTLEEVGVDPTHEVKVGEGPSRHVGNNVEFRVHKVAIGEVVWGSGGGLCSCGGGGGVGGSLLFEMALERLQVKRMEEAVHNHWGGCPRWVKFDNILAVACGEGCRVGDW